MLTNRKGLAMTSSTGKTMLINHFLINDEWYRRLAIWIRPAGKRKPGAVAADY